MNRETVPVIGFKVSMKQQELCGYDRLIILVMYQYVACSEEDLQIKARI